MKKSPRFVQTSLQYLELLFPPEIRMNGTKAKLFWILISFAHKNKNKAADTEQTQF